MNKRGPIAIDPRKQINFIGVIIFIELLEDLKQFSKVFGVRNKPKNPEATPMPRDREKNKDNQFLRYVQLKLFLLKGKIIDTYFCCFGETCMKKYVSSKSRQNLFISLRQNLGSF